MNADLSRWRSRVQAPSLPLKKALGNTAFRIVSGIARVLVLLLALAQELFESGA
jgi:hypothetical protein